MYSTCGAACDLLEEEKNGFTYFEADITTLCDKLELLIADKNRRESMGYISKMKIRNFSHGITCQNIKNALYHVPY